jgi:hypothetical protein
VGVLRIVGYFVGWKKNDSVVAGQASHLWLVETISDLCGLAPFFNSNSGEVLIMFFLINETEAIPLCYHFNYGEACIF